ncbi:MAG: diaminopimelate epimerase [Gemmatimonadaceae bacterium]
MKRSGWSGVCGGGRSRAAYSPGKGVARLLSGRSFWKLTGSGNDFVFFDARAGVDQQLLDPVVIDALCDRRSGVGADGIVLFEPPVESGELYSIRYFNRDGTLAEMCGNAALCGVRIAQLLGVAPQNGTEPFAFHTSSGRLLGRSASADRDPQILMPAPGEVAATCEIARGDGEQRLGFARVGVPHLVLVVDDLDRVDVEGRGRELRMHPSLRDGANVNFISLVGPARWAMRTYERGVEAETLACGSGAVAVATLLAAWGLEPQGRDVTVITRGGRPLVVTWSQVGEQMQPFLSGEGRLVYSGVLADE